MAAKIVIGKPIADAIKSETAERIAELREVHGIEPRLVVVRVGEDPASAVYVGSKVRMAEEIGMASEHIHLDYEVSQADLLAIINDLNRRDDVDGILVQLPLPGHIAERDVLEAVDPQKDVDGFHPINVGKLAQGCQTLAPCTPAGVIEMLKRSDIEITGKHAVVVGRSNIVGKPMAMLLLNESATVTICHSRTKDLASITRQADILVVAVGRAGFIGGEHIGKGAVVVDVGINNVEDESELSRLFPDEEIEKRAAAIAKRGFTLSGDVNAREAIEKASVLTPVPGGVGLLTVAMLMKNTVTAAIERRGL